MNEDKLYYLDTSALLPYYREEAVSQRLENLLISLKPPLIISDLAKVEFASALARWVRMKELSESQADFIEDAFSKDNLAGLYLRRPMTTSHYNQATKWLQSRKTALRTLDALHLACCWANDAELLTCDAVLHQAAEVFGLKSACVR